MELKVLKQQTKEYALRIGIDKIGFCDAAPLLEHLPRLVARKAAACMFAIKEGDPEKRVDPAAHLPTAASVISVAVAYAAGGCLPCEADGPARGRMSLIARGLDYHVVVRDKLARLQQFIASIIPEAKIVAMTDKEEILEKAIAVKAGLGWFGKNTLLVTPEYGPLVCLGELVTDIPFPPDRPLDIQCGSCRQCITACPAGALGADNILNPDRCLAGITQYKGLPPHDLRGLMGNLLYGCDTCQTVCPFYQKGRARLHPEFTGAPEDHYPLLTDVLTMTNAEFNRRFGLTSAAWRGKTPIQRNAAIAAGNLRDISAIPAMTAILARDNRPVMRGAAAWALGKIGTASGKRALEEARKTEKHPKVMAEIEESLMGGEWDKRKVPGKNGL